MVRCSGRSIHPSLAMPRSASVSLPFPPIFGRRSLTLSHASIQVHCSGGAQTKVLHFIDDDLHVVKDNL